MLAYLNGLYTGILVTLIMMFFVGASDDSRESIERDEFNEAISAIINFQNFWHVGRLEICPVSKFQLLCMTLGGRKTTKSQNGKIWIFRVPNTNFNFIKS